MRVLLAAACLFAAACDRNSSKGAASTASAERTLTAAPLAVFPSFDAWCGRLTNGVCKGQWEGYAPGATELGAYRFVVVEVADVKEGAGSYRDIYLELRTSRGLSYLTLGRTRDGQVTTSVLVKEVLDRPGALEVRWVFRNAPRLSHSDFWKVYFIVEGRSGPGAVEVALGNLNSDSSGNTEGTLGEAQWRAGTIRVKGASLIADGDWAVALP
jgi:hypothetical protein